MKDTEDRMIPFPCCPSAKVIVSGEAGGCISTKCPVCGRFARFDLDSGTSESIKPARGAVHRLRLREAAEAEKQ